MAQGVCIESKQGPEWREVRSSAKGRISKRKWYFAVRGKAPRVNEGGSFRPQGGNKLGGVEGKDAPGKNQVDEEKRGSAS